MKVSNGATLNMAGFSDTVAGVTLTSGSINGSGGKLTSTSDFQVQNGNVGAILGGAVGLTKSAGGTVALTAPNTYSGGTTIVAGTLVVGNAAALGSGGLVLNGGLLDLNANSIAVRSLSGFGGTISDKNTTGGTSTLKVNQFTTTSFAGTLADGPTRQLALVAAGSGTLTLDSADSYSGGTAINAGTLVVGNTAALGSGGLVLTGGLLDLNANSISVSSLSGFGGTITDRTARPEPVL